MSPAEWASDRKDDAVRAVTRHPLIAAIVAAVVAALLSAAGTSVVYTSVAQSEDAHRDKKIGDTAENVEHLRGDLQTQGVQVYRLTDRMDSVEERQERLQVETYQRLGDIDRCLREACWRQRDR